MGLGREEREKAIEWDLHEVVDSTPLEFTDELKPSLFGIDEAKAQGMVSDLKTAFAQREVLKNAFIDVIDLEVNTENLPIFKELRLKFVKNRTSIEKWHTTNKAFYLAGGRFVDAIKNKEILEGKEIESRLLEAEKYFENQEKQKAKDLNDLRISKISPWVENAEKMDFKEFSDQDFEDFVFGKKIKHEQRIEAERLEAERLEKERIAKEKEIEMQRLENIRLKSEADATAKKIESERLESERLAKIQSDKLAEERSENARVLKEANDKIQAKKDAEIKAENERIEKENADKKEADKLAKAPIKKQLGVWVDSFEIASPIVANETTLDISRKFESLKNWAKLEIEKL